MFETLSERSGRIVFLSRKLAGRRGATAIEVEDLIEALVIEDQGDFLAAASENTAPGAAIPVMETHQPFFTAETAAKIQRELAPLKLPKGERLPDSADMAISEAMKHLLEAAKQLSEEISHEPTTPSRVHMGYVEPLHLLVAALSDEKSEVAEVLKQAGLTQQQVSATIQRGDSF
jgi:ATP-dependent Clp protease ATP-binding subunit ClpA